MARFNRQAKASMASMQRVNALNLEPSRLSDQTEEERQSEDSGSSSSVAAAVVSKAQQGGSDPRVARTKAICLVAGVDAEIARRSSSAESAYVPPAPPKALPLPPVQAA